MAAIENINLSGNLHFRPLSSHLTRAVRHVAISTRLLKEENTWQGHVVDFISTGTLFVGSAFTIPIALIETITSLSLASIGLAINYFFLKNQSEFLQKHSLKCLAFAVHGVTLTIRNFCAVILAPKLRYHTVNALKEIATHLGSAAFIQFTVGFAIDRTCNRPREFAVRRAMNLLSDSHPSILQDVARQIERDFNVHLLNRLGEIPVLDEYLANHPEDLAFLQNFNLNRIGEPEYRLQAFHIATRFLAEMRLIFPEEAQQQDMRLEITQVSPAEKQYQDALCRVIRDAIIEVHSTEELAGYLNAADTGQDRIEMIDPSIIQPVLMYSQYKEITEEISCPNRFTTNRLEHFNPRRGKLLLAHAAIIRLTQEERNQLRQKILRGSDYEAQGSVQDVFLQISELYTDLERGPLITRTYIDLENVDLISNEILYKRSWQDALTAIAEPV